MVAAKISWCAVLRLLRNSDVEKRLTGIAYRRNAIEKAFSEIDVKHYFGNIEAKELTDLLVG